MTPRSLGLVRLFPIAACLLVPVAASAEPDGASPTAASDIEHSAAMTHRLTATPDSGVEGQSVLLNMAVQGHAASQYLLALMHLEQAGPAYDRAEAIKWLERAAARRHEGARAHLADMAARGDVAAHLALGLIARDIAGNSMAAARHLRAAAAAGDPQGLLALGELYGAGSTVDRDEAYAAILFRSAAAAAMAAVLRARRGAAAGILGPDSGEWLEIAAARTRSAHLSPPAGNVRRAELFAHYWVGLTLLAGAGTAADTPRGLAHHRAAAERGFALAEFSLGQLYERGHGLPRDRDLARQWFERAAAHGHPLAASWRRPDT